MAFKNQKIKPAGERSVQEALDLLKDTYASAGERDIMTGDSVEFMVRPFSTLILPFVIDFPTDHFVSLGEERVFHFDSLPIPQVITAAGVAREIFELKKD